MLVRESATEDHGMDDSNTREFAGSEYLGFFQSTCLYESLG